MKKTVILIASVLLLFCLDAAAQVSNLGSNNDMGNNGGTTHSLTYSWTAPSGTTSMAVCFEGDVITGGHDDITGVTYAGTSLTQVGKYSGSDGSGHNNRFLYLYKLNSPTTGSANNIVISSTNNHYLLGVVSAYGGSSDIGGNVYSLGPTATASSPWTVSAYTEQGGSMEMFCAEGGSQVAGLNSVVEIQGSAFAEPSIIDTGGTINPPDSLSMTTSWSGLNGTHWDDIRIMAEVLPSTTQLGVLQSTNFASASSWTFNASDSGLESCDVEAHAYDTSTSTYSNVDSNTTFSCDVNYNVKATFTSGTQTGIIVAVPNPRKCALALAPCPGTPPGTTHGRQGPVKVFVSRDSTSSGSHTDLSNSISWTHTIGSSTTCPNPYLIVALVGGSAPWTSTATVTYNGTSMTQLANINVSGGGNPELWVFGLASPATGAKTVSASFTNWTTGNEIRGDSQSYCNVGAVTGGQTTPHNEIFTNLTTSPSSEPVYPLVSGAMVMAISSSSLVTALNTSGTYLLTYNDALNHPPDLFDNKNYTTTANHFNTGLTFSTTQTNLNYTNVILTPPIPVPFFPFQHAQPTASNTWTINQSEWGGQTCDYTFTAWDTTTSPYTDITSSATNSCDGSNNITLTFGSNKSGIASITQNATVAP